MIQHLSFLTKYISKLVNDGLCIYGNCYLIMFMTMHAIIPFQSLSSISLGQHSGNIAKSRGTELHIAKNI